MKGARLRMDRKIYTDNVYCIMKAQYPKVHRKVMFNNSLTEQKRLEDLYVLFEKLSAGSLKAIENGMRDIKEEY